MVCFSFWNWCRLNPSIANIFHNWHFVYFLHTCCVRGCTGIKTAVVADARKDTYTREVLRHEVSFTYIDLHTAKISETSVVVVLFVLLCCSYCSKLLKIFSRLLVLLTTLNNVNITNCLFLIKWLVYILERSSCLLDSDRQGLWSAGRRIVGVDWRFVILNGSHLDSKMRPDVEQYCINLVNFSDEIKVYTAVC